MCKSKFILKPREEIQVGNRKIVITRVASGEDKTREAVLRVMGPGYIYKNE